MQQGSSGTAMTLMTPTSFQLVGSVCCLEYPTLTNTTRSLLNCASRDSCRLRTQHVNSTTPPTAGMSRKLLLHPAENRLVEWKIPGSTPQGDKGGHATYEACIGAVSTVAQPRKHEAEYFVGNRTNTQGVSLKNRAHLYTLAKESFYARNLHKPLWVGERKKQICFYSCFSPQPPSSLQSWSGKTL